VPTLYACDNLTLHINPGENMRNLIFVALLTACSTSKITKTVETIDSAKVGLQRKAEISAHYIDHQPIEAEAKMVVDVDALGNKTYTNDNFSFTVDAKGGTNFNKESVFYIGTFTKLSGLGSAPVSFGKVGKTTLKSDKDYVLELLHYNLIKEARAAGADALLGDISYEWKIEEKSDLQTRLFGLLPDKVVSKNVVYTVTGYSKTAKMVMDPHQAEDNSNNVGSAGTDIKLNLDISTEGSASGGSSSGASTAGGVGGLFKK
jgi:hypothetical protein